MYEKDRIREEVYEAKRKFHAEILNGRRCVNCGELINRSGPETWHFISTLIACDPESPFLRGKKGTYKAEAWAEVGE